MDANGLPVNLLYFTQTKNRLTLMTSYYVHGYKTYGKLFTKFAKTTYIIPLFFTLTYKQNVSFNVT